MDLVVILFLAGITAFFVGLLIIYMRKDDFVVGASLGIIGAVVALLAGIHIFFPGVIP